MPNTKEVNNNINRHRDDVNKQKFIEKMKKFYSSKNTTTARRDNRYLKLGLKSPVQGIQNSVSMKNITPKKLACSAINTAPLV